jgi:Tol biopolymer transport system component
MLPVRRGVRATPPDPNRRLRVSAEAPPLASGRILLHYRLTEKLGQGGMGEVWAATDSTLDRSVAIKALPAALAADPERLARFEREARLLASLNHPNIATVHSVHVVDGRRYLIMELVLGEDLSLRIARGPAPVAEALEIIRQMALALGAAHEQGVIHRDLKPANVRITPEGAVKVLDFGLAKAFEPSGQPADPGLSQSPTFLGSMTPGVILGTAGYMAPEQARGQAVDRRADLWALGVILYELLAGARAFEGETVSDTLAAVLRSEPDPARLPADLAPPVRLLLDRLLAKDPRRRLRDVGGVLLIVEEMLAGGSRLATTGAAAGGGTAADTGTQRPVLRRALPWVAAAAGLALAATAGMLLRPAPPAPPLRKFTLALAPIQGSVASPALSPDGRWLAMISREQLWVRDLRQGGLRMLAQPVDVDLRPAWSPDSRFLVFADQAGLSRVTIESGAVQPVCKAASITGGAGVAWLDDRTLVFTRGTDHLYRVAAAGGVPDVMVARIDSLEIDIHHPFVLPDGKGILVARHEVGAPPNKLSVIRDGRRHDLLHIPAAGFELPIYDPRGYIVYGRSGGDGAGLWAARFSLDRLAIEGDPFLITARGAAPTQSEDGLLAYLNVTYSDNHPVIAVDRSGSPVDTVTASRPGQRSLDLSPDGRKLAIETRTGDEGGIWLCDLERGAASRFAFGEGQRFGEVSWSPDSRTLAYVNIAREEILVRPADGSQAPRIVGHGHFPRFTPDGNHLMYSKKGGGKRDLWMLPLDAPADSAVLLATPADEDMPRPAPQGGYYLYLTDESGRYEAFLRTYPQGTGLWQVSSDGADRATWNVRGDRIYLWDGDRILEVTVQLEGGVALGTPRLLFDASRIRVQSWGRHWMAPAPDPDRFLFFGLQTRSEEGSPTVELVENWSAEFGSR